MDSLFAAPAAYICPFYEDENAYSFITHRHSFWHWCYFIYVIFSIFILFCTFYELYGIVCIIMMWNNVLVNRFIVVYV